MEFKIRINELDEIISHKLGSVGSFSEIINEHFSPLSYGNGVNSIVLIIILIRTKPGYEKWYKVRKPKFIEHKVIENKLTGCCKIIEKEFVIETRLDFDDFDNFLNSSETLGKKILASEILKSLSNLDSLPKKVKDFDKERFMKDMKTFFNEQ